MSWEAVAWFVGGLLAGVIVSRARATWVEHERVSEATRQEQLRQMGRKGDQ